MLAHGNELTLLVFSPLTRDKSGPSFLHNGQPHDSGGRGLSYIDSTSYTMKAFHLAGIQIHPWYRTLRAPRNPTGNLLFLDYHQGPLRWCVVGVLPSPVQDALHVSVSARCAFSYLVLCLRGPVAQPIHDLGVDNQDCTRSWPSIV